MKIKHKHKSSTTTPKSSSFDYGEIGINYKSGNERIYIKNDSDQIVEFIPLYNTKSLITFEGDSITLQPNVYYRQSKSSTQLAIYLGGEVNTNILNEYLIEFSTGSHSTTISLPSSIKWANGEVPTFEKDTTYQISIVNNLGVCLKFK